MLSLREVYVCALRIVPSTLVYGGGGMCKELCVGEWWEREGSWQSVGRL